MKSLEALENIKRESGLPYFSTLYDIDMWHEDFKSIKQDIEVLQILIIKEVNIGFLKFLYKKIESFEEILFVYNTEEKDLTIIELIKIIICLEVDL